MEHFVEFDTSNARDAIWLDGRPLVDELRPLPAKAWPDDAPLASAQRIFGIHLPERGRTYSILADGNSDKLTNAFVSFLRNDGASNLTARHYLYDLRKFARSLALADKTLLKATSEDTGAYRRICLEGEPQHRLSRSSWSRTEAALGRFYQWAHETELIASKPKCRFKRKGALKENTVRLVSLENYLIFRDIGLLGCAEGARIGQSPSGLTPLRDAAYVELGLTTGMRQTERSSLLLCELPLIEGIAFRGRKLIELRLPETITKYQKIRFVPFPRRVLIEFIHPYVREERTVLVDRWRKSGGARNRDTLLGWLNASGRVVLVSDPSKPHLVASLTIPERRRLALLPYPNAPVDLAEPAALWLNDRGHPMAPEGWASMLRRSCERLRVSSGFDLKITDHMLRHSFAVHWLSRLIKVNLSANNRTVDALSDQTSAIYKKVVGDPLRQLQRWLGHASSLTTQIYLTYVDEAIEQIESATELFDEILSLSDWS